LKKLRGSLHRQKKKGWKWRVTAGGEEEERLGEVFQCQKESGARTHPETPCSLRDRKKKSGTAVKNVQPGDEEDGPKKPVGGSGEKGAQLRLQVIRLS